MKRVNFPRMSDWILVTILLTAAIYFLAPHLLKVTLYKVSLITLGAVLGYWIDRSHSPYARPDNPDIQQNPTLYAAAMQRRAILAAACIIGICLGA